MHAIRQRRAKGKFLSIVKDLRRASEVLDSAFKKSAALEAPLRTSRFIARAGEVQALLYEIMADICDVEPEVTPHQLRPSLRPVDLGQTIEQLTSRSEVIRENAIRSLKTHMPGDSFQEILVGSTGPEKQRAALRWWDTQPRPFLPVLQVFRQLSHERKFMRYHAARLLEREVGGKLLDQNTGDVDQEAAKGWVGMWARGPISYARSTEVRSRRKRAAGRTRSGRGTRARGTQETK